MFFYHVNLGWPLLDEGAQQGVERSHHVRRAVDLERAELLDPAHARFLDIAGDDAGERPAQIGGQLVGRQVATQLQVGHRLVGGFERALEIQRSSSTSSCRTMSIWATGPPNAKAPNLRNRRKSAPCVIAGGDGSRQPSDVELDGARFQGTHIAELAKKLHG